MKSYSNMVLMLMKLMVVLLIYAIPLYIKEQSILFMINFRESYSELMAYIRILSVPKVFIWIFTIILFVGILIIQANEKSANGILLLRLCLMIAFPVVSLKVLRWYERYSRKRQHFKRLDRIWYDHSKYRK